MKLESRYNLIKDYAKNCMELNADKGVYTALMNACSFYNETLDINLRDRMAFEIVSKK